MRSCSGAIISADTTRKRRAPGRLNVDFFRTDLDDIRRSVIKRRPRSDKDCRVRSRDAGGERGINRVERTAEPRVRLTNRSDVVVFVARQNVVFEVGPYTQQILARERNPFRIVPACADIFA